MRKGGLVVSIAGLWVGFGPVCAVRGQGAWEVTSASEEAVRRGLAWLARSQGPEGNWGSNDLGLVALGALAFLSAGHLPDEGPYGKNVRLALDYMASKVRPSGLLNESNERRDMYNHGLATFVLTQAYGMSGDERIGRMAERGIELICETQCRDGSWDYVARRQERGHDLSICVMQAIALRGAMDAGIEVPPQTVRDALAAVRRYYRPRGQPDGLGREFAGQHADALRPGQFTYRGTGETVAMAAAGVVCLQEFGEYGDFRIFRSMQVVTRAIRERSGHRGGDRGQANQPVFDAYTLYYVSQALYQVGGEDWRAHYPLLRDGIVRSQRRSRNEAEDGSWDDNTRVGGLAGRLFGTSAAVFALSIPNRYLPILQQASHDGNVEAIRLGGAERAGAGGAGSAAGAGAAGDGASAEGDR